MAKRIQYGSRKNLSKPLMSAERTQEAHDDVPVPRTALLSHSRRPAAWAQSRVVSGRRVVRKQQLRDSARMAVHILRSTHRVTLCSKYTRALIFANLCQG
jgi:hypothetical protein